MRRQSGTEISFGCGFASRRKAEELIGKTGFISTNPGAWETESFPEGRVFVDGKKTSEPIKKYTLCSISPAALSRRFSTKREGTWDEPFNRRGAAGLSVGRLDYNSKGFCFSQTTASWQIG
jgi:16S rRNA U516 pseudouridylate synthase RsuA-like enzyme